MHTRILLAIVGVLILLVIGFVRINLESDQGRQQSRGDGNGHSNERAGTEQHDANTPAPKSPGRHGSTDATIANLRKLGFVINADRVGRTSAGGSVEVRAPDGTTIAAEELKVASSGDAFFLSGGVRLQKDSSWMATEDENAYVKISTKNGHFSASKARWEVYATAPNKAQK